MIAVLMMGALAVAQPQQWRSDTTFSVERGFSMSVHNDRGSITVSTWSQNRVRVTSDDDDGNGWYTVRERGRNLDVRTRSRRGPAELDLRITVPVWMELEMEGTFADMTVEGTEAQVDAHTTHGDIFVAGGTGLLRLQAVNGDITLEDAAGRIDVETMNGDVEITRSSGDVRIRTTNGEIDLDRMAATGMDVFTVNGDVYYDGTFDSGGVYSFSTHNGDVTLIVDAELSAEITISTVQGELETDCPVRLSQTRSGGRQFNFEIGEGAANISLESFGGTISLNARGACWGR